MLVSGEILTAHQEVETVALAAFEGAIESLDDLFAHVDGKMADAEGQADAATTGRGC